MQNAVVDKKAALLFDKYWDSEFVNTTQQEIEDMRNKATTLGVLTSIAAFGLNEVARLTMRSRKYSKQTSKLIIFSDVQVARAECGFLGSSSLPYHSLQLQPDY